MATSVKQMLEAANAAVPRITPAQALEIIAKGAALVVDVRDAPEVEKSGKVAGAVHVSRGMLEFRADPESSYYDKNFAKWPAAQTTPEPPPAIKARFPDLIAEVPQTFERRVRGRLPPLRIGWGMIRPARAPVGSAAPH
jgi:hypothetical protein